MTLDEGKGTKRGKQGGGQTFLQNGRWVEKGGGRRLI